MAQTSSPPFSTLLLMISFASVNAVLFTPALPSIEQYFHLSDSLAQQTITWFLIGYTMGQLIYGPIANRFGRKPALYLGILIQIISSLMCASSAALHSYNLLLIGRLFMAIGSGVGLKMTFTLLNETHDSVSASKKLAYLMLAFAITPGLGVMLGGILNTHFGWNSTFYACAIYGVLLLTLTTQLTETKTKLDYEALKLRNIVSGYAVQLGNRKLVCAALLVGSSTCIVYTFATLAPFIAINQFHMTSATYGQANLLPPIGLIIGLLLSAQLLKISPQTSIIKYGISLFALGSVLMLGLVKLSPSPVTSLFIPMMICYAGLGMINANASSLAISRVDDKANGSAVLNFINMGFTTIGILLLGLINIEPVILPAIYLAIGIFMATMFKASRLSF